MTYYCPQCSFTSNFESALLMHQQLHHDGPCCDVFPVVEAAAENSNSLPRELGLLDSKPNKGMKLPARTSSATRLFDRLRARICRSRTLFAHPEESADVGRIDLSVSSECTSKAFKEESPLLSKKSIVIVKEPLKETFGCHLCSFEADRITSLDRHLLNDHKIGMESLLKLVMAKTTDGLAEDRTNDLYGLRTPYYKPQETLEEGEFIIETVTPKIKILKHASTNTETIDLRDNCKMISNELERLINCPVEACDKDELLLKMQTLNECMCKFVDSSNMLKKVLTKEYDTKSLRNERTAGEPYFDLRLGDHNSPREWERAHSEKMERSRKKHSDSRGDKSKLTSESFYF